MQINIRRSKITLSAILLSALLLPVSTLAQPTTMKDSHNPKDTYAPYNNEKYPKNVYFGDTHLHTSYSVDAGLFANTIGPDEAYRFAKGEKVKSSTGIETRLKRPLDFLVVTDHSENLGLAPMVYEKNPIVMDHPWGKKLAALVNEGKLAEAYAFWSIKVTHSDDPFAGNTEMVSSMWKRNVEAAEKYNEPGKFTALIGYEWTSSPAGSNLHRNVIFRDNGDAMMKVVPFTSYDSFDPEKLWEYMANLEKTLGVQVLAIPHNGNLSNGLMFDDNTFITKKPIDAEYAKARMRWEPLYEVTQMKGDGETHPELSSNDEFADFETWDKGSFGSIKEKGMIEKEYAREAYKRGLQYEEKLGVNPFKFGLIGASDTHTSLATTSEDNFFGKASILEPSELPVRFEEKVTGFLPDPQGRDYAIYARHSSASGLAGVWAQENTRESLWDSMSRKEVYATTGTRLRVRVFAGWDFKEEDLGRADFAHNGYKHGVPMGGDMKTATKGKSPKFMIKALRDPDWANLDRIQIIKGWTDAKGNAHEKVYDVSVSGDRKIVDGRCKTAVGNTVNEKEAYFDNSIGEPTLQGYWEDPDFDVNERAFYYVRVLEIPTPRWTTYDAKYFNVKRPTDVPVSIQDRAYTSPIWYTPTKK